MTVTEFYKANGIEPEEFKLHETVEQYAQRIAGHSYYQSSHIEVEYSYGTKQQNISSKSATYNLYSY